MATISIRVIQPTAGRQGSVNANMGEDSSTRGDGDDDDDNKKPCTHSGNTSSSNSSSSSVGGWYQQYLPHMALGSWMLLNIVVTILNKGVFAFGGFQFPMSLSAVHMLVSGCLSWLTLRLRGEQQHSAPTTINNNNNNKPFSLSASSSCFEGFSANSFLLRTFLLSFVFALNIVLGNLGIRLSSISVGQIIRSLIPGVTMFLSFILLKEKISILLALSMLPICLGVMLTVQGDVEGNTLGVLCTGLGAFLSSLKVVLCNKLLVGAHSMDPLLLLWKLTPMALVQIGIMVYFFEWEAITNNWDDIATFKTAAPVLLSAVAAFLLNISNFFANKYTSPLTITVGGNLKQVFTIVISIIIFKNPVTMLSAIGMTVCTLGAIMYSMLKYHKM